MMIIKLTVKPVHVFVGETICFLRSTNVCFKTSGDGAWERTNKKKGKKQLAAKTNTKQISHTHKTC